MKNWVMKSIAVVACSALMVPAASAFAEAPQNPELVTSMLASKKKQALKQFNYQTGGNEWISPDTIIVKHSGLAKTVHSKIGSKVIRSIPSLGYEVVQLKKGVTLEEAFSYYGKQNGVKSVSPSYKYYSFNTIVDPKKKDMYHLDLLQIDKALSLAGNHEVKVAVIDSGVDYNHPDLKSQILPPYNAATPANTTFSDPHGTHVAGIIAATKDNGFGGYGVFPAAKILPIDVFNGKQSANDFVIAQGILHAIEQNADVINMSLGGYGESPLMQEAVQKAIDKGITIVAAAGNDSTDHYSFPASFEGVISVGSTNKHNKLSSYSNYGPSVDIVAPGEEIYSTVYDEKKGSSFTAFSGTSMASPVVAGVAALLKSKYPTLKPHEIEAILEMTAKDLGERGYDLTYGHGLVDPFKALHFDLNNLPKRYSETNEERLNNAKVLDKNSKNTEKGEFKLPDERKWYKIELDAGEYAQLSLKGASYYDYAFDLYFYPTGQKDESETINVNDVRAGKQEGYLYKADQAGTLLIGVKDYNGSYSLKGASNFIFTAETTKELPIDSLAIDSPYNIQQFPFSTAGENYTLLSEDQQIDKDYFTFSVTEPSTLKFDLSGIPGVTASMEIYLKSELDSIPTDQVDDEEQNEIAPYPIQASFSSEKGENASIVFDAIPEEEYVLSVSNDNSGVISIDILLSGGIDNEEKSTINESIIPYTLKGEIVHLPEDEDGLPLNEPIVEDDLPNSENAPAPLKGKKRERVNNFLNISIGSDFEENGIDADLIMENAIPYNIGESQKAYFQTEYDEDYFVFTAPEDAIYGFQIKKGYNHKPAATLLEYDEEKNELLPLSSLTNDPGLIGLLYGITIDENDAKAIALKKDKTYVVKIINIGGRSIEPYTLSTSKMVAIPDDKNNDINSDIDAQTLVPGKDYQNHLLYNDDKDYYYYKQRGEDTVLSLLISSVPYTNKQLNQLPKELQFDLKFSGSIIEDTNGNMQIDDEELATEIPFGQGESLFEIFLGLSGTSEVNTSFLAKRNRGYFITINGTDIGLVSLQPYTLSVFNHKNVDEDANSTLVNGLPTEPTKLTKSGDKYVANQYLNASVPFGDKDYFEFYNDRKRDVFFSLQTEKGLDGVIRIIDAFGKTVETLDLYGSKDTEVGSVELDKGTYYIEVSELNGKASTKPYTLEVQ
ncbi:S8 family peptidase [Lysinibacillus sp. NPDC097279]|uniref:S8 family peptidase n=1 Tax=Lysinibacillus sp. NPDC097279 TaxID=3364143 RepID=UPI0038062EBB